MKKVFAACAIIGAFLGAGFLSGREVFEYFSRFGKGAYIAMFVSACLLAFLIWQIAEFCSARGILSVDRLCKECFPRCNRVIGIFIKAGAISTGASMLACSGELLSSVFGFHPMSGMIITVALCLPALKNDKVMGVISLALVGIMVCFTVVLNCVNTPAADNSSFTLIPMLTGFVFVLYNLSLSLGVVINVPAHGGKTVAIISAAIVLIMLLLCDRLLHSLPSEMLKTAIPLYKCATQLSSGWMYIYTFVLWAALYTTLNAVMRCFYDQTGSFGQVAVACTLSLALAFAGFENIVRYVYPFSAVTGTLMAIRIIYLRIKNNEIFCNSSVRNGKNRSGGVACVWNRKQ